MRRLFLIQFILIVASGAFAQNKSLADTILLHEVVTYAPLKKYQAGAKIETIPAEQMAIGQSGSIDQLLMRFTPIYLKSNAGGLATIHFRGTSANHTSVNFGGINVNSLTLGQCDMTSIPSFLFDEIELQYGSSSAVNGSGSIGGALNLGLASNWTDGINLKTITTSGSFGEQFYGTKFFVGNGRFESVTRFFYFSKINNFPFKNIYTGNVEDRRPVNDIQHGANIENIGLIQELNYRFSKNEFMKSAIWLAHDWHQIQPNMQTNFRYKNTEDLDNKNLRLWSEYQNNKNVLKFNGGLGYVHDMQVYNKNKIQKIGTKRSIVEFEVKQTISANFAYKTGIKHQYIVPEVYAYSDSIVSYEQHFEAYFSSLFNYRDRLKLTVNFRQMTVTNFQVPFTPSVGFEYKLITAAKHLFNLTGNINRSYRVPTLNDRYWGNQGNKNLKPEDGLSYELGGKYIFHAGDFRTDIRLNAFYMNVKNWIAWRDYGIWQAQNVSEVDSKGIELQTNTDFKIQKTKFNLKLNYNFNPVETLSDVSEKNEIGKQLIYTPKNMANGWLMANYQQWQGYIDGTYTGVRYAESRVKLDSYFLANCGIIRNIKLNKQAISLSFHVNNLFNQQYQNERYFAMPGRSFRISLSSNLNLK